MLLSKTVQPTEYPSPEPPPPKQNKNMKKKRKEKKKDCIRLVWFDCLPL